MNPRSEPPGEALATDRVILVFPARTDQVRLARLVVSSIATEAGSPLDTVDDLRIGLDELCSVLISTAVPGEDLAVVISVIGATITCRATVMTARPDVPVDRITEIVLSATVASFHVTSDGHRAVGSLAKTFVPVTP